MHNTPIKTLVTKYRNSNSFVTINSLEIYVKSIQFYGFSVGGGSSFVKQLFMITKKQQPSVCISQPYKVCCEIPFKAADT